MEKKETNSKKIEEEKLLTKAQYFGKKLFVKPEFVSERFGDSPADWVLEKQIEYQEVFVQKYINLKGTKYKWLLKLWLMLNK